MFNGKFKTLVTMRIETTKGSVHSYGVVEGNDPSKEKMQAEADRVAKALGGKLQGYTFKTEPARKSLNPSLVTDYSAPGAYEMVAAGRDLPYRIF